MDAASRKVIADMSGDNRRQVVLRGGRGGKGNQHYATPTMQVPKYAQPGQPFQELEVLLELKVIADVGLVGFPNVGKSTFLSRVTNAKPKIANYHFTTLSPNLGVVDTENGGFIIADIREDMINKIKDAGAVGFVTVCGTPLDQGEDRTPIQYRRKACDLPGAAIHYLDAVEIVEKEASMCRLNIQQSEISRNSANVAVRILGTEFPEEIVTVTAHYDSVPEGPGAYDNMSGGAMAMEAFLYFAEHRPARTMEFIWFGSEEKGLIGSQNYVKSHENEMGKHVFNLNVDLAGQLLGGNVLGVTADPTVCAALKALMEENQLGVTIKNQVWASDSNTFAWKAVPALTLNRDGFGMHTRHDTVEYISPRALAEGAKTLCTAAAWVANEPELSFEREIPADMKRELEKYFAS